MAGKRDEVTIAEVAEALNISKTTVFGKARVFRSAEMSKQSAQSIMTAKQNSISPLKIRRAAIISAPSAQATA